MNALRNCANQRKKKILEKEKERRPFTTAFLHDERA
jgi:hypothetical protein